MVILSLFFVFPFLYFPAEVELESIQERYIQVLRIFLQHSSPQNPQARLNELLSHIPEVSIEKRLQESQTFSTQFGNI